MSTFGHEVEQVVNTPLPDDALMRVIVIFTDGVQAPQQFVPSELSGLVAAQVARVPEIAVVAVPRGSYAVQPEALPFAATPVGAEPAEHPDGAEAKALDVGAGVVALARLIAGALVSVGACAADPVP